MSIAFRTLVFSLSLVTPLCAQQPEVTGTQVETRASKGLPSELNAVGNNDTAWIGYSIPVTDHFSNGYGENETVYLEGDHYRGEGGAEKRQQFDHANVLLRVDKGAVTKIRLEIPTRKLDTGGVKFVWLTGVQQDDSIREFVSLAKDAAQDRRVRDSSVMVIAQHETSAATSTLTDMARTGDAFVKEKAAFWLAAHRGEEGTKALLQLTRVEQDEHLRGKLAFDLTLSKDYPKAIDELIWMAKNDSSPHVRKEAQFWMAQKAGKRATGETPSNSPERPGSQHPEVRSLRNFAVARWRGDYATDPGSATSKDPDVRKQAVFWLGQSQDPKALEYLTKILSQN